MPHSRHFLALNPTPAPQLGHGNPWKPPLARPLEVSSLRAFFERDRGDSPSSELLGSLWAPFSASSSTSSSSASSTSSSLSSSSLSEAGASD